MFCHYRRFAPATKPAGQDVFPEYRRHARNTWSGSARHPGGCYSFATVLLSICYPKGLSGCRLLLLCYLFATLLLPFCYPFATQKAFRAAGCYSFATCLLLLCYLFATHLLSNCYHSLFAHHQQGTLAMYTSPRRKGVPSESRSSLHAAHLR